MKTIIEPFRVKTVERLRMTTRDERREILARAHYNLFRIRAEDILIDLLDRLGHRRDVGRAVGRHHARGRVLRRRALVVPLPRPRIAS